MITIRFRFCKVDQHSFDIRWRYAKDCHFFRHINFPFEKMIICFQALMPPLDIFKPFCPLRYFDFPSLSLTECVPNLQLPLANLHFISNIYYNMSSQSTLYNCTCILYIGFKIHPRSKR